MVDTEIEMMDTLRSQQKRWLGHVIWHDSLLRIMLEGRIQGEKGCERPRSMFLDWLLKTEEDNIGCKQLKMLAQDRSRWCQWRWKPAIWAEYYSSSSSSWNWSGPTAGLHRLINSSLINRKITVCLRCRVLGSLLSAHLIIRDPSQPFGRLSQTDYDDELLHMAHDLGTRLLAAFENTATGIPHPRVSSWL